VEDRHLITTGQRLAAFPKGCGYSSELARTFL